MRRSRNIPFHQKKKTAAVVDGQCEFWYLQMLIRNEKSIDIDLKPEIPQKKRLKDQFEKVIELARHYDKVLWIIDYDVIHTKTRSAKRNVHTPTEEFKSYVAEIKRDHENVTIIINNPCLEFWFLLHFEFTEKFFNNCEDASKQLKKHLPDYQKTSKYFTKQNNDIYLKLKPKLATAIANAKKLKAFNPGKPVSAMTQMQLLFEMEELKSIFK